MKKLFFRNLLTAFLLISVNALAQNPTPNIGFETGTFDYWQCYIGSIDMAGVITVTPSPPAFTRHTIFGKGSAGALDPYGLFPILCPNGSNYSVRLGNDSANHEAERLTYSFTVPLASQYYSIIFNYAVVLENPTHLPFQQPKFTAQVFDITDNKYIDCPSFDFVASSGLPGFKLSPIAQHANAGIYYKDWSTATIDLSRYSGKAMRLEFTTNDCVFIQHFGYAYLDVNENSSAAISGNTYCAGQKAITLFGPNGFASYTWYNANLSKQIGTGQSLRISPSPPNLTSYAVVITPYLGIGCVDTLYTTISKIDEGFKLNVPDTIHACVGSTVDLTAAKITAGSSPGMTLSYFTDSLATSYLYNPRNITAPGVYYIQGVNSEGCMNISPVQVVFSNPVINVVDPPPVVFPTMVDISKTFTAIKGQSYRYYSDAEGTAALFDYTTIKYGGTYYIKTVNSIGCSTIAPVHVVIHPPPPYVITAPNIFTPNNDNINDHFTVTLNGIAAFGSVKIYNRYGQLVFMAKSPTEYWNGTFNGQNVPSGTYYWVLEGTDIYYNTTFTKASSITLLR